MAKPSKRASKRKQRKQHAREIRRSEGKQRQQERNKAWRLADVLTGRASPTMKALKNLKRRPLGVLDRVLSLSSGNATARRTA